MSEELKHRIVDIVCHVVEMSCAVVQENGHDWSDITTKYSDELYALCMERPPVDSVGVDIMERVKAECAGAVSNSSGHHICGRCRLCDCCPRLTWPDEVDTAAIRKALKKKG